LTDLREQLQLTLGDGYTIERELGGGGMSRVFLAEERALGRMVVVKVLPFEAAGEVSVERFKREIALAAQLQHPHIVPLLTAGEADGLPYFTMPYVRGESLRLRLSNHGELPLAEAVRVLREIASALAFAHEQGIIHRDIKPENILVAGGSAMVTDFGVAKALSASTGGGASLTSIGVALGTPAYMSPEQASADPLVDHRADIYSWGMLAYELLTGQPPFASRPPQAMLAAHVNEAPELVTKRRAGISPSLAQLVMICLEKRPADRPQTADELVRALDALATPSGVMRPAGAVSPETSSATSPARRIPAWIVGAAIAASLVVAGISYSRQLTTATRATNDPTRKFERRIAVMPFAVVGHDSTTEPFGDGIADELTAALGKVHGLRLAGRQAVYVYRDRAVDPKRIGKQLGVDALLTGTVQRSANRMKVTAQLLNAEDGLSSWSGSYVLDVKNLFAVEDSIAKAIVGELKVSLGAEQTLVVAGTQNAEAHDLYLQGMFYARKHTEATLRRAIVLFEQAHTKDPLYAAPLAGVALAWGNLNQRWVAPKDAYAKIKPAVLAALRLDSTNAAAHSQLAAIQHAYDWDLAAAEHEFATALRLDPRESDALLILPNVLIFRGLRDSAIAVARHGVQADPVSVSLATHYAFVFTQFDQLDSAEVWFAKARELDPAYANASFGVHMLYVRQKRWADCLAGLQLPTGGFTNGYSLMWRPICEAGAGRTAEARRALDDLVAARTKRYIAGDAIAAGYAALGDRDAAFKWLEQGFNDRSAGMVQLYWRVFDSIRDDPRFRSLEQRIVAAANKAP
jgi:eukaryotic-like serine/threonine-protein kinase